jgi:hypothetical protein
MLLLGLLLGLLGCLHLAHSTLSVLTQCHSLSTGLQGHEKQQQQARRCQARPAAAVTPGRFAWFERLVASKTVIHRLTT